MSQQQFCFQLAPPPACSRAAVSGLLAASLTAGTATEESCSPPNEAMKAMWSSVRLSSCAEEKVSTFKSKQRIITFDPILIGYVITLAHVQTSPR